MNSRTPTPNSIPAAPAARTDWYIDSAYIEARLRAARRARSEAFGQLVEDGWLALCRHSRSLLASRPKPLLRHGS